MTARLAELAAAALAGVEPELERDLLGVRLRAEQACFTIDTRDAGVASGANATDAVERVSLCDAVVGCAFVIVVAVAPLLTATALACTEQTSGDTLMAIALVIGAAARALLTALALTAGVALVHHTMSARTVAVRQ